MSESFQFADKLSHYVARSVYTSGQLASLTGLPRTTIVNWQNGRVQRPRDWEPLIKLLAVLHVDENEANEILQAASQPTVSELYLLTQGEEEKALLATWIKQPEPQPYHSPFQAISDIPYFVGRQEILADLTTHLLNQSDHSICTVQGMAGTGKTVLAARLAYQLRAHFPDGVLWARLDTSDTMTILQTFAQAYGTDVSRYSDVASRSRSVRNLLANKRVLLIFDNVLDSKSVEPLLPPTGHAAVLITTRRHDLHVARAARQFILSPFIPDEKARQQLFIHFLGKKRVEEEWSTLAEISQYVGNLPLALAIIAGRLAYEPGWSSQDFLGRLTPHARRLKELRYEDQSVRLAFEQSYALLTEEERPFFTILSLFSGEDFSVEAAAAAAAISLEDAQDHLRSLYRLSLIQLGSEGRYQLHPLLRDFSQEKLTDQTAVLRIAVYFQTLLDTNQLNDDNVSLEINNILGILAAARGQGEITAYIQLTLAIAPFLERQGMYTVAKQHLHVSLDIAQAAQKLPILLHLIRIARSQRDFDEADSYLETAVSLAKHQQDNYYMSAIFTEKGIIAGCRGDYGAARSQFEAGLLLARKHQDPAFLIPLLKELGASDMAHGHYNQAEKHYQEALILARQTMPIFVPTLLRCLGGIALTRDQDFRRGAALYEEGLHTAQQLNNREDRLLLHNNLAVTLSYDGKPKEAIAHLTEGLAIARSLHHATGISMILGNLGRLSAQAHNWVEATQYLNAGLSEATAVSHYELIILFHNSLGYVAGKEQNFDEAEANFQKALDLSQKLNHRGSVLRTLENWGWLYEQQRETAVDSQFPKIFPNFAHKYHLDSSAEQFATVCKPYNLERLKIFYD